MRPYCHQPRFLPVCRVLSALSIAQILGFIALQATVCHAGILYTGVNLAGAEFGEGSLPGTYNTHYTYPTSAEVDYYISDQGMNTIRLPFRWERLQQSPNAVLNAAELNRMNMFVNYATSQGAHVILDPHNYARYYGDLVGSGSVPNSSFSDFWSRVANQFKGNDKVIFGLMNEPHTMSTEQWAAAAQEAINTIRATGAENLILVPGNAWTGAHSWTQNWYGTPNAQVMLGITDPGNNFAFDVHQYLDNNSSGQSSFIVSETIGQERLVAFTNWLHTNNRRGFLGEFAVANSTIGGGIGDEAITNMLNYIEANDDVWLGWSWWAGGPWWGNYMFTLEPTDLGQPDETDRPALAVIKPFFAVNPPLRPADFDGDGDVDGDDLSQWDGGFGVNGDSDADSDGDSDGDDFLIWQREYTGSINLQGHEAAVPEPSSSALLLVAWLIRVGPFYRWTTRFCTYRAPGWHRSVFFTEIP